MDEQVGVDLGADRSHLVDEPMRHAAPTLGQQVLLDVGGEHGRAVRLTELEDTQQDPAAFVGGEHRGQVIEFPFARRLRGGLARLLPGFLRLLRPQRPRIIDRDRVLDRAVDGVEDHGMAQTAAAAASQAWRISGPRSSHGGSSFS